MIYVYFFAGYGSRKPEQLRQGRLDLLTNDECLRNLLNDTYDNYERTIATNKVVCAGSVPTTFGINSCRVRILLGFLFLKFNDFVFFFFCNFINYKKKNSRSKKDIISRIYFDPNVISRSPHSFCRSYVLLKLQFNAITAMF